MKIKYLGTGAAEGVPALFCDCDYCKKIRSLGEVEFRTRSQVIIDDIISVDFPPEAYAHSLKSGLSFARLKNLLITHSHMDHFYAHDFILRGYKYAKFDGGILNIYGNAEVEKVFNECTAREMKPEIAEKIKLTVIKPYKVYEVGGYKVITIPANHSKTEDALLFYVEKGGKGYLHLYDTGRIGKEAFDFLKSNNAKADIVSFDCTFGEVEGGENSRHMGVSDCRLMKDLLVERNIIDGNTKLVITHFSHNCNPTRVHVSDIAKKHGFIAAYDGMETEV